MVGLLAGMALATGCGAERPRPRDPLVHAPAHARAAPTDDCPTTPALEWHLLVPGTHGMVLGEPFGIAGHVLDIGIEDPPPSLVGTLDVKGAQALEAHTRALARITYGQQAVDPTAAEARFAVVLDHRVLAVVPVTTTLRGGRFRVPLEGDRPAGALAGRLREAAAIDRLCFAGRAVP